MPMVTRRRVAIYGSDMIYSAFEADVFVFDALDGSTCTSLPSLFFFQAEDGIRYGHVTGVQTCALPISRGRIRHPAAVRGVSRIRAGARLPGGLQRAAGAQLVHGGPGERGSGRGQILTPSVKSNARRLWPLPGDAVWNWVLALATAALLVLTFPRFRIVWFAPIALTPLLVAVAREPRPARRFLLGWAAGVVYWFGVCYWIQFVLSVHGGLGEIAGWAVFTLFAVTKALHMAVFALLAGILMRRWWAIPAVAALWVAIEVTHGPLGFAWLTLGNAGIDMSIPLRLAPYTGVYGLSFVFAAMAAALALALLRRPRVELAWMAALPLLVLLPAMPPAERGNDSAVLLQPNISETEDWTPVTLDRAERRQVALTLESALRQTAQRPALAVWPEVPAPFYYYEDPRFRRYVDELARTAHTWLLIGVVAHTPEGAPLNSAVLVSPEGFPVSRYDKVNLVPFGEFVPWPFGVLAK